MTAKNKYIGVALLLLCGVGAHAVEFSKLSTFDGIVKQEKSQDSVVQKCHLTIDEIKKVAKDDGSFETRSYVVKFGYDGLMGADLQFKMKKTTWGDVATWVAENPRVLLQRKNWNFTRLGNELLFGVGSRQKEESLLSFRFTDRLQETLTIVQDDYQKSIYVKYVGNKDVVECLDLKEEPAKSDEKNQEKSDQ